jgi:streptogramin lyase
MVRNVGRLPRGRTHSFIFVAPALGLIMLCACTTSSAVTPVSRSPTHVPIAASPTRSPTRTPWSPPKIGGHVVLHGVFVQGAAVLGESLYVWDGSKPNGGTQELLRIDPASDRVIADLKLGDVSIARLILVRGHLWAVAGRSCPGCSPGWVIQFNPQTLAVVSRTPVRSGVSSVAAAGGWLWAAGGRWLYRLSLLDQQISARIRLSRADSSVVTADPEGQELIVSEAREGNGRIQRRDPNTGALIATSAPVYGIIAPRLAQVIDGRVWFSEGTGMQGYISQVDVHTLRPTHITLPFDGEASNDISAQVMGEILYVQQADGGKTRNYCGDPGTGKMRAPLPLDGAQARHMVDARIVTADAANDYYLLDFSAAPKLEEELVRFPVDPRCRG